MPQYERLREVLNGASQEARDATLEAEVATGELQYEGSLRLRNALLATGKALHAEDEKAASSYLDAAEQELRLAALISLRDAATALYLSTCGRLVTSRAWRRAALFRVIDTVSGNALDAEAREVFQLAEASCSPAEEDGLPRVNAAWKVNLDRYRRVIDICQQLQSDFPTRREVTSRVIFAGSAVLTVLSWTGIWIMGRI